MRERAKKWIQTSVTVEDTASDIIAGDPSGQDIFIQNNDSSGIVYLNFTEDATASTTDIVLNPGDAISAKDITNTVSAIGSIASNANVAIIVSR